MSDVTVSQLAESINTSVERLLKQMADAGLPQRQSGDNVSDEQKQILLQHLRESHGAVSDADSGVKKITLKRKTLSTIKTGSGTARKTVSVEVRKKRTYIKREDSDADTASVDEELPDIEGIELEVLHVDSVDQVAATEEVVVDQPVVESSVEAIVISPVDVVDDVVTEAAETIVDEPISQPEVKSKLSGRILGRSALDDAEHRRQAAILARREAEEIERKEMALQKAGVR